MKRTTVFGSLILLVFSAGARDFKDYSHSYFGVYGQRAAVMGRADGSALEIWSYPYKVLHDLSLALRVEGKRIDPYDGNRRVHFGHDWFERNFHGESWHIREQVYPEVRGPGVYLVYTITTLKELELEFSLIPDLDLMWPGAVGGKFSYWDRKGFYVLREATGRHRALFGPLQGEQTGRLPAHKLPGGKLIFKLKVPAGKKVIPLLALAGKEPEKSLRASFIEKIGQYDQVRLDRIACLKTLDEATLTVHSPDDRFNRGFSRAKSNLHFAWVHNPDLGSGLVAGYGLSGEGERPGFAWYFGGDGLINSHAMLNYGDFDRARREMDFLLAYQREDGKIPHEISQAAPFIPWFTEYGFAYFHGDTTLHFVTFLGAYLNRTRDTRWLWNHRTEVNRMYRWMLDVDRDADGIVETGRAGTGASETGPLRQEMKTDIYLAALSVSGWSAMEDIYRILEEPGKRRIARNRGENSRRSIDRLFWDPGLRYPAYAVREEGNEKIREVTIWPAIGMRHGVFDQERGRAIRKMIASPWLSTDWGVRFLSARSVYYDPLSYNNGAVWPFLTGAAALALYRYHNPYHAFSLLQANMGILQDFDPGCGTELLSGRHYIPLDQSVPDQAWSSGNTISACVEGLLGFSSDRRRNRVRLSPSIPLIWNHLTIRNLKVFGGSIDMDYRLRTGGAVSFEIALRDLSGVEMNFTPCFPAREATFWLEEEPDVLLPSTVTIGSPVQTLRVSGRISGYLYPYVPRDLVPGEESRRPIIEDLQIRPDDFQVTVWGRGASRLYLTTDQKVIHPQARFCNGGQYLPVEFAPTQWERREVTIRTGPTDGEDME